MDPCSFVRHQVGTNLGGAVTTYPCGLCWKRVERDFSGGQSEAGAPSHCWCLKDPVGWAASAPAPTPHHREPMPTCREEERPHKLYQAPTYRVKIRGLLRTYPRLSCSDVLQGSYSSLPTRRVAVAALQDELIQSHHLRVPEPIRPLRLARHFRQYGQTLVTLPWERTTAVNSW